MRSSTEKKERHFHISPLNLYFLEAPIQLEFAVNLNKYNFLNISKHDKLTWVDMNLTIK